MGAQKEPCAFTIIPAGEQKRIFHELPIIQLNVNNVNVFKITYAGKPDPLTNCSVFNHTSESFQVACVEGFDGGLHQEFGAQANLLGHNNAVSYVNSK